MQISWKHPFIGAALGIVLPTMLAVAEPLPGGLAPITPPAGGFAIDGDLLANSPLAGTGDWTANTNIAPGSGLRVLNAAGTPLDPLRAFHFVDVFNDTADQIFGGGEKWMDNPNTWQWATGKPSSKTDINNVLLSIGADTNGHIWAVIAADRLSTSGDSYIDFEFLQSPLTLNANGSFASSGPNAGRTTNDVLLSIGFSGGGKVADFTAWRWQSGGGGFAYSDATSIMPAGKVFVALNSNTVAVPYGAFGQTSYAPNAFVEAAIDLTALLGNFDPCVSVGFKTIMVKTKASTSSSASIEDFIQPIQYNLNIGPSANAGPDQVRCRDAVETLFPLHGTASSGLQSVSTTTWSVINGTATIDDANSLVTTARVTSSAATLRLTVAQANGCVKTDDIVLTAQTPPSISINGVTTSCPRTTNTFSAPSGAGSYLWSVTGNGSISGPANQASVKVIAGAACGVNYTVTLVVSTNVCTASDFVEVVVEDTGAPALTIPQDLVLDCPAVTTTNVTGVATATDGCSRATVIYSDSETIACGSTRVIARTWTATDECGNAVSKVQTITVRDVTAPVITAPPSLTLDCPADGSTSNAGVATAIDACGSAVVTFTDAVVNNCGNTKVITRTWRAVDQCGNSSTAVQTITIRDITPPVLTYPGNVIVECGGSTAPSATGNATALDACSTASLNYTDTVTNLCGGTKVISRRWTATDSCGNSTNAVQTITVRDTTPPSLVLPSNRVLDCPGDTRTNSTGVATASDICGSVVLTYSDIVTNGCGTTVTVQRRWTAVDQCGNSTNGVQTIVVQDKTPPTISIASIKVQCVDDVPPAHASLAAFRAAGGTANDGCDADLTFSLRSDSGLVGSCPGTVTRVYRVTDDCGNFADATQTITVDDTIAPNITCPGSVTVACGDSLEPSNLVSATSTDNCDSDLTITHSDVNVPSTYLIKWYAADPEQDAGPYAPTYMKFGPGSLPCPSAAQLNGRAIDPLRNAVAYSAPGGQLDALTSMGGTPMFLGQVVPFEAVIEVGGGPGSERGTIEFTSSWSTHTTSNDRFGYDTNYMVYCAFVDAADPGSIDPRADARVEAFSSTVINRGTIDEKIQGTFRITGLESGDRVVVEIWVVLMSTTPSHVGGTIASDLVSAAKATTPPTPITTGAQTVSIGNLSKIDDTLPPPQSQPPAPSIPPQPPIDPGIIVSVIDRTWAATDDCGNRSTCVQRIAVRDSAAPTLVVPADVVLEYPSLPITNNTGVATALDGCGFVAITYSDIVSNSCGNAQILWRVWKATDINGNTSSATQMITVQDSIAPSLNCPPNAVVEFGSETSPIALGAASASDFSGAITISFSDTVVTNCGRACTISRLWTASDPCGNLATATQTITVQDTTPPVLSGCTNKVIYAGNALVFDTPTATDHCSTPIVSVVSTTTNYPIAAVCAVTRTWTATDACGNVAANQAQTITVLPPLLTKLEIVKLGDTNLLLRWPTNATGYRLEWSYDLTKWSPVAITPIQTNGEFRVYTIATQPGRFFRLVNTAPTLEIQKLSNGQIQLSWPTEPSGFALESSNTLLPDSWSPVTTNPRVSDAHNRVDVMSTGGRKFFRLKK